MYLNDFFVYLKSLSNNEDIKIRFLLLTKHHTIWPRPNKEENTDDKKRLVDEN